MISVKRTHQQHISNILATHTRHIPKNTLGTHALAPYAMLHVKTTHSTVHMQCSLFSMPQVKTTHYKEHILCSLYTAVEYSLTRMHSMYSLCYMEACSSHGSLLYNAVESTLKRIGSMPVKRAYGASDRLSMGHVLSLSLCQYVCECVCACVCVCTHTHSHTCARALSLSYSLTHKYIELSRRAALGAGVDEQQRYASARRSRRV